MEREIKIGDYVRCGSAGIRRVTEIKKNITELKITKFIDHKGLLVDMKYVQDYSSNPLDLVQIGDCINNKIITNEYYFDNTLYRDSDNPRQYDKLVKMKKNELETFITKEQLKEDAYFFDK